jgi:hypothetical protein
VGGFLMAGNQLHQLESHGQTAHVNLKSGKSADKKQATPKPE